MGIMEGIRNYQKPHGTNLLNGKLISKQVVELLNSPSNYVESDQPGVWKVISNYKGIPSTIHKLNSPQKKVSFRSFSTCLPVKINPWFLTGFTDGEGTFSINIKKAPTVKLGWTVEAVFKIEIHKRDEDLLNLIREFWGVGAIYVTRSCLSLRVTSLNSLVTRIVPQFDNYPLISQKKADYILWREIVMMMQRKEHLSAEGLQAIVNIRASINWGLSESLKEAYPNTVAVKRP